MNDRLRVMGKAFVELADDTEFRTRLRSLISQNATIDAVEKMLTNYLTARGLDSTEAMLLCGMFAMGGCDAATVIEKRLT